jgi:hypothetical protein
MEIAATRRPPVGSGRRHRSAEFDGRSDAAVPTTAIIVSGPSDNSGTGAMWFFTRSVARDLVTRRGRRRSRR